jgi:hypothetical protein
MSIKQSGFETIQQNDSKTIDQLKEALITFCNEQIVDSKLRETYFNYINRLSLNYKNQEVIELLKKTFLEHQIKTIRGFGLNTLCIRISRLFLSKIESREDINKLVEEKKINTIRDSIAHNIRSINTGWPDSVMNIKLSRERVKYIDIYREFKGWYLGE